MGGGTGVSTTLHEQRHQLVRCVYECVANAPREVLLSREKCWGVALKIVENNKRYKHQSESLVCLGEVQRIVHIPVPIVNLPPGTVIRDRMSKHTYRFVRSSAENVVLERTDTALPLIVGKHEWNERFADRTVLL